MNKLPSDWQIKTINEVCNIYTGNSINKKKKEENFIGLKEGLNYIGTKDISFNNIIEYENGVKIPFKDLKDFKIAKSNTSLLCIEGGSAGRKIGFTNQDVCFGNKLCCFEAIEDEPKFIYFYLQSNDFLREFNSNIQGLIGGVNKENLRKIKIPIPPLDEQKRIASALSKIDAYLENTIKLIEEKERFKRGIAKKLLTCKEGENIPEARFKGFNDDWRKEKLSSMIKIQGGYAFKSSEFKKSGIPIIRISNISNTDNNMNMKEVVYYNEIENEKSFIIKKSDLLIALSGAPGKSSIYNLEEKAYLNQRVGLFKIIDTKKINNSFLSQYVFSSIFQNKLKPFITRGVQPNISPKDIENLDILLPSLKEQEKIGGYLSLLDKEIDNLKKQKELIKEMKRGAMQKLLSGKVRLLE